MEGVALAQRYLERWLHLCGSAGQPHLAEKKITCSMSRKGNCWDNAIVESSFATQKDELEILVPVQGMGRLRTNIGPAEPLTAAGFPIASQAETACDENTSG